ncbi:MAG: VWA domain-containing protein [Cryomorphaceae bacterium]|nr:VWA domain-containing protein [Cryomorphaceae bacterium]
MTFRFLFIFLMIFSIGLFGQTTRILFILDASGSMNARWDNTTRWDAATETLTYILDSLNQTKNPPEVALRVYGHQRSFPPQYCDDTKLEVAFHSNSYRHIRNKLKSLKAKGTTPIAYSLEKAAGDFPECADCRNIIIILTDGKEECEGDPCKASHLLQAKGIAIRPYIIGMGMELEDIESLRCVGKTFPTKNPKELREQLALIVQYSLLPTSVQVDLLDEFGKPSESDVAISLSEKNSGDPAYHFIHTLNRMGRPDTILIDPAPIYTLTVHSTPPVVRENIDIAPGKHNHIGVTVPRGEMQLSISPSQAYKDLRAIVRKKGSLEIVNNHPTPGKHKYLAGTYVLEILTLPPITQEVIVKAGQKADVKIPGPGTVTFQANAAFYGHILHLNNGKWQNIYTFQAGATRQVLAMQPGKYKIVYRPVAAKSIHFNNTIDFDVNTGGSTLVKIP